MNPHGRVWQKWGHRQEAPERSREEGRGRGREGERGRGGRRPGRGRRKKAAGRDRRRARLERLRCSGGGEEAGKKGSQGWGSEERRHAGQGL